MTSPERIASSRRDLRYHEKGRSADYSVTIAYWFEAFVVVAVITIFGWTSYRWFI